MREELLGYLLGALEPDEHRAIETQLRDCPELRDELETLRATLLPLEASAGTQSPELCEPPPGLAERTCQYVRCRLGPTVAQFAGSSQWRLQDMVVAMGIFVAGSLLLFPAVLNSRQHAQLRACQHNLMNLGQALAEYSEHHDGYFPRVPTTGNLAAAGIYAPSLVDRGLIRSASVICPASPLAKEGNFRVPRMSELRSAQGERLRALQARMGGSYGYSLGYVQGGRYHDVRNRQRETFALMSDAPDAGPSTGSTHHDGRHNVLFEDGHVRCVQDAGLAAGGDHIFRNRLGFVGAGIGPDDAVVAPSEGAPVILGLPLDR